MICCQNVTGTAVSGGELLDRLYQLSSKNLIYSSSVPEDEIISLCKKTESVARNGKDYPNLFRIEEIMVNSYCLKGDMALAVSKAQQMYHEASILNNELGIAWSVQAIGVTYMHANQFQQAYTTFAESDAKFKNIEDNFLKINRLICKLHICLYLDEIDEMQHNLIEARILLDHMDITEKWAFAFYVQCYQTLFYIHSNELKQAWQSLEQVRRMNAEEKAFDGWIYHLTALYYELAGDYDKALVYCDSSLQFTARSGNLNEYKNRMISKAGLLSKQGKKKEACSVYGYVNKLDDSLNVSAYSRQIDSLKVTYWIDQMALENSAAFNMILTWVILCGLVVLIGVVVLIRLAKRKNQRLIASRKKLEEIRQEVADSMRSKSLFLSNMSHEIRTPLNAIVGFSGLLTSDEVADAETRLQCSDLIKQNSDLLLKLVNDVSDLSALKNDEMKFTLVKYDAIILCRNVVDTVDKVKRTSAAIRFVTELDSFEMVTDPERLQQVLINLLVNATKFTQEGEIMLRFEVDRANNEAVFSVEDTGCGIPIAKQPHIFNRFEKLHEGVQGAGLGLSICQLIVEHFGGKIWIDSGYTSGARFVFTHPLDKFEQNNA